MILTAGRGKNKRQWELSDEEFEEFEMMFEENELVDMSEWMANVKLTKVDPPAFTAMRKEN